ncbi:hypothetical protein [Streptomyces sp. NBC_00996]|uniref:hypothetical protein n=1 Tax=Streptomyces sp. NBC_00996 TaxID=2903710 RepID=UPI00386E4C2B|nr:DUF11 domain-containing protein [Streptomyces sp. NBC_00996]
MRPRPVTGAALTGALLLGLTACGVGKPSPWITAPEVFYLRPLGDKSGPSDKEPFHLRAEDGRGTGGRRLTADVVGGSEDAVRLRGSGGCKGGDTHVTCEVGAEYNNWADLARVSPVAAKGSKPGDTGVVRFTYTTKDGKRLTARTRFVVGEPVVEALVLKSLEHVSPGVEVTSPVVVRNTGEVPVVGLGLELSSGGLEFEKRYANCRYPEISHHHIAVCRFPDLRIAPGETVVLRPALRLRAPKTQMYTSFGRDVWALDMGPGQHGSYPKGGDHGDGPTLEAEVTKDTKGTFAKGGGHTYLALDTHADYEVSDVDLHGAHGTKRTLRLTVRNNGPADSGSSTQLVFSPPFGLTLLKQPMEEYDDGVFQPYCESHDFAYTCDVGELGPGKSRTFEFTVRLGDPGEGTVSLVDKDPPSEFDFGRHDPNPSNDEATITVGP